MTTRFSAAAAPGYEIATRPSIYALPTVVDDELQQQLRLIQQMEEDEALARALQEEDRNPEETRRVQQHNKKKKRQEQVDEEAARRLQHWYDVEEPQREAARLYALSRVAAEERHQVENDAAYALRLSQGLL
jgi:hypothetical protein